jgi:hypothetical protein
MLRLGPRLREDSILLRNRMLGWMQTRSYGSAYTSSVKFALTAR